MSWSRVSFASWSTTSLPSMPQWLGIQQKRTHVSLSLSAQRRFDDMTNERRFHIFALNRLQARHWVRVEYNIVLYSVHVPIIVQCQGNGCNLSSKDGAVIWEFLGQLAAGRLNNLESGEDSFAPGADPRCSYIRPFDINLGQFDQTVSLTFISVGTPPRASPS